MKKLTTYCLLLISMILYSSCIKDDSTGADRSIANIEFKSSLEEVYAADQGDVLTINAPEINQSPLSKEIQYSWEVNGKVMSTDKTFQYICTEFGKFQGRLKVTNGDDTKYAYFTLNVKYAFTDGLIILSQYQNRSIISYYPSDKNKKFKMEALTANKNVELGSEPLSMYVRNDKQKPELYVSTSNPNQIYRINANMMFVTDKIDQPLNEPVRYLTYDGAKTGSVYLYMVLGNRFAQLAYKSNIVTNGRHSFLNMMFGQNYELAPYFGYSYASDGTLNQEVYFDNKGSKMGVYYNINDFVTTTGELFKGEFSDMQLCGLSPVGSTGMDFAGLLKSKNDDKYYHIYFTAGYHNAWSQQKNIKPELFYKGEMPAAQGLDKHSVMVTAAKKNLEYYSAGNKVYIYNVLSKGQYPAEAGITCGSGEVVADMYVNADESLLYIGTNDAAAEKQGSIYCYDIASNKMLWSKQHITGKIVKLGYKTEN